MPFMANGQSAVLYPPNLIYNLLPLRFALLRALISAFLDAPEPGAEEAQ